MYRGDHLGYLPVADRLPTAHRVAEVGPLIVLRVGIAQGNPQPPSAILV